MKGLLQKLALSLFIIYLTFSALVSHAQSVVDAGQTVYARIDSISAYDNSNIDSLYVDNTTGFSISDTVLVFQSKGALPISPGNSGDGSVQSFYNTGKYTIVKIQAIEPGQKLIVINTRLFGFRPDYKTGEYGQLIKIPSYQKARITSDFDFPAWDPVRKTGGVFAIIAGQKLVLDSDLSADGKGFKGAFPDGNYDGPCSSVDPEYQKEYYTTAATDSAALKGEGIVHDGYLWMRGFGRLINAGGGGNGKFSGGGGGSNMGQGGKGGNEINTCLPPNTLGGEGGQPLSSFASNNPADFYYNRIFMGGGGGTGTRDTSLNRYASAGGNGGGVIIIIADTIEGNNFSISSKGRSVESEVNGGAGGGGAGGTIVLDVRNYTGPVTIEVNGGDGGSTIDQTVQTGPGGGGGGGAIWYSGESVPANVTMSDSAGKGGMVNNLFSYGALSGSAGKRLKNLQIPINGFILNFMPDEQTICEGEQPEIIDAAPAKGGDGSYTYKWQQSSDGVSWNEAPGANSSAAYQPPTLYDTTWYRRIVDDGILPADTSFELAINVHPKIVDNLVAADDTICFNNAPADFIPLASPGGGLGTGSYSFIWQQSQDTLSWSDAPGMNGGAAYEPAALTDTTWFHRIIISGVCADTSNRITVIVLDSVRNNFISPDQEVCNNQIPDPLSGTVPQGGLPGDKRYLWQIDDGSGWQNADQTQNFMPPALEAGNYNYRRIFFSGASNECVDTSNQIGIISWPDIDNNDLISSDSTICANLPSISLRGTEPTGGSGNYIFSWQAKNSPAGNWADDDVLNNNNPYSPGTLNNDRWFRRLIFSGEDNVCADTSSVIHISVLPAINSNTISSDQLVCEGIVPAALSGTAPGGGAGTGNFYYQWQVRQPGWPGFDDVESDGNEKEYIVPALSDTSVYRRLVFSGPEFTCKDTSNQIAISVLPAIENNAIEGPDVMEVCLEEDLLITAGEVTGGDGSALYAWQVKTEGGDWIDAPNENSQLNYSTEPLLTPKYFRRIATSSVCTDTSEIVKADTLSLPLLTEMTLNRDSVCHLENNLFIRLKVENAHPQYTVNYVDGISSGEMPVSGLHTIDSIRVSSFPQERLSYEYRITSITDSKGCKAKENNLSAYSARLELFPDAEPEILLADNIEICNSTLDIQADPDIGNDYHWTVSNDKMKLMDSSDSNTQLFVDEGFNAQEGWLVFHSSSPGCLHIAGYTPSVDSVQVSFYEQPEVFNIEAETERIFMVDHYWVNYTAPTAGHLNWSVVEGGGEIDEVTSDSTLIVSIPLDILCRYRATLSNGVCEPIVDEILIERKDVHVYEGFSPANEDMINDVLIAEGLDAENVNFEFQVFATNGLLVRTIKNEDIGDLGFHTGFGNNGLELWDGKAADEQTYVPQGVYYYILLIDYKGQKFTKKGFVVIKE